MTDFVAIDALPEHGGGQMLRTALALSVVTGRGFQMTRIRAGSSRPGLQPAHLTAVRAIAMTCDAKVNGAFDGSPDLRFEPGTLKPGEFRFEIETAEASGLILQTVLVVLSTAGVRSRVAVTGGTHVPGSPSYEYLAGPWAATVGRIGIRTRFELVRAGFYPAGGGEMSAVVEPWARPAGLILDERGPLRAIRGVSASGRLKTDVARRQREAAESRLWEARRLASEWAVVDVPASSPGAYLFLDLEFERGRAAFGLLGERGVRPEQLGDRAARQALKFLDAEGAVDPWLADQLALPLGIGGIGGRVTTPEVTERLENAAAVLRLFGVPARTWGRRGGPGGLEVERC